MGRKKIEIRPLTDERNRNVTFLKRKAGLMKKAWELSVLCGAEVSILIFSAAGKPYEFSSRDLDSEIDRYLDYEGLIERRRGEEFAAMAEAGEDDEDDDDDDHHHAARRGSMLSKPGQGSVSGVAGQGKPVKSLKGKESYKKRMVSRKELAREVSKRSKKRRGSGRARQGFIDGMLSGSEDDDDHNSRESSDMANLNYAMNMPTSSLPGSFSMPSGAGHSGSANNSGHGYPNFQTPGSYYRSNSQPHLSLNPSYSSGPSAPGPLTTSGTMTTPQTYSGPGASGGGGGGGGGGSMSYPPNMGGMQWDQSLLQRYAEFQLQQSHQKQQRALLDRQRQQLAELGVPVGGDEERRLLDDIFGAGGASGARAGATGGSGSGSGGGGGQSIGPPPLGSGGGGSGSVGQDNDFVWPSFGTSAQSGGGANSAGQNHHHHQHHSSQSPMIAATHDGRQSSQSQSQSQSQPYYSASADDYVRHSQHDVPGWSGSGSVGYSSSASGGGGGGGNHGYYSGNGQQDETFPSPVSFEDDVVKRQHQQQQQQQQQQRRGDDFGGMDKRIRVG